MKTQSSELLRAAEERENNRLRLAAYYAKQQRILVKEIPLAELPACEAYVIRRQAG